MKKLLNLLFIFAALSAFGQDHAGNDPYIPDLYFNQDDFGERFAVMTESDDLYGYFVTDLTKFSTHHQKIYFLNSIYADNSLISIDSDVTDDQLWFKVPLTVTENDAVCSLEEYRDEAIKNINSMTGEERSAWMENNKKFQSKND